MIKIYFNSPSWSSFLSMLFNLNSITFSLSCFIQYWQEMSTWLIRWRLNRFLLRYLDNKWKMSDLKLLVHYNSEYIVNALFFLSSHIQFDLYTTSYQPSSTHHDCSCFHTIVQQSVLPIHIHLSSTKSFYCFSLLLFSSLLLGLCLIRTFTFSSSNHFDHPPILTLSTSNIFQSNPIQSIPFNIHTLWIYNHSHQLHRSSFSISLDSYDFSFQVDLSLLTFIFLFVSFLIYVPFGVFRLEFDYGFVGCISIFHSYAFIISLFESSPFFFSRLIIWIQSNGHFTNNPRTILSLFWPMWNTNYFQSDWFSHEHSAL